MVLNDMLFTSNTIGWVSNINKSHIWEFCRQKQFMLGLLLIIKYIREFFYCRRFIRRCKQGGLQFVILKPILVVLTLILYSKGKYHDGNFNPGQSYLYLTIIYTVSYTMALYALALFYVACKELLRPFNPVPKFIIIKSVVFLTYWQVYNKFSFKKS